MSESGHHSHEQFVPFGRDTSSDIFMRSPEGLTGEEMLAQARLLIEQDYRLDDAESRQRVYNKLTSLIEAAKINAPILLLNNSLNGGPEIKHAGYVSTGISLIENGDRVSGNWTLGVQIFENSFSGKWRANTAEYSMQAFIDDAVHSHSRLLVGEEEVRTWLQRRGLLCVAMDNPDQFHIRNDLALLKSMRDGRLPISYLNLDSSQLQTAGDYFSEILIGTIRENTLVLADMHLAYKYLASGSAEGEEYELRKLYDTLLNKLLPLLPLRGNGNSNTVVQHFATEISHQLVIVEGIPPEIELSNNTRSAAMMSLLYHRLSQQTTTEPDIPPLQPVELVQGPWPIGRTLHIFTTNQPSAKQLWEDISYIDALRREGQSSEVLKPSAFRLRKALGDLNKHMTSRAQPNEFPIILRTMEYLVGDNEQQRRQFYREVLYSIALIAPVGQYSGSLMHFVELVEAVQQVLPSEMLNYREKTLTGVAAIAALISDMYAWRKDHYLRLDIARQGTTQDETVTRTININRL